MRPLPFALLASSCLLPVYACGGSGNGNSQSSSSPDAGRPMPDGSASDATAGDSSTMRYSIGGAVLGLQGTGLVLAGSSSLFPTFAETDGVSPSGASPDTPVPFSFQTLVPAGLPYQVTVETQPTSPSQDCEVMAGSGTVPDGNVTSVVVNCSTDSFVVGGTIAGTGGGNVVLTNNGGDAITVHMDGSFAFPTPIASGGAYSVAVATNPDVPSATCSVAMGTGHVTSDNVTSVSVTCVPNVFKVGGHVVGLAAGSSIVLTDNGSDHLTVTGDGAFTFTAPVTSGSPYVAAIETQPAGQQCTLSGDHGTVGSTDVTGIVVNCSSTLFAVGGTVSGLVGQGLTLQGTGGSLQVNSNGSFVFPMSLASGSMFSVQIAALPVNPAQTCTITGNAGTVTPASVNSIDVMCAAPAQPPPCTVPYGCTNYACASPGTEAVTLTGSAATAAGPRGNADEGFSFGLTDDLGGTDVQQVLPQGGADRTMTLWVKAQPTGNPQTFFNYGTFTTAERFGLIAAGAGSHDYFVGENRDVYGTFVATDATWHAMAVTYTGSTATLYFDGAMDVAGAIGVLATTGYAFGIGHTLTVPGREPFEGVVSDIRVYGRVLTGQEIASLATFTGNGANPETLRASGSDLVFWLPLFNDDPSVMLNRCAP